MRAKTLSAGVSLCVAAVEIVLAGAARALPPPPYAQSPAGAATDPMTFDRYGGGPPPYESGAPQAGDQARGQGQDQGQDQVSGGRPGAEVSPLYLDWTGKAAPARGIPAAPAPALVRAFAPPVTPPPMSPPMAPRMSSPMTADASPQAPRSIYDAPVGGPQEPWPQTPAAGSPLQTARRASSAAAAADVEAGVKSPRVQTPGGPRFYSVHRDYGIQPDAIPLPPQFFGQTADLSTPPTPVVKTATSANGQTRLVPAPGEDQPSQ